MEKFVNLMQFVIRLMTHLNVGAALGMVAWIAWSGWQLSTGQLRPMYRAAEVKTLVQLGQHRSPNAWSLEATPPASPTCHDGAMDGLRAAAEPGATP